MRERQLIDAIHRRLPMSLFRQGMTGAAMTGNGVPDYYYDGPKSDLWIEYKQLKAMPRNGVVNALALVTPLQSRWLHRRSRNGQNAAICVGLPNKRAVLFTEAFDGTGLVTHAPATDARTYNEVAAWICDFCGCS